MSMLDTTCGPRSVATLTTVQTGMGREMLTRREKTALISQVTTLETSLFDKDHHLRRGVGSSRAEELLSQINALRRRLGWLPIDDCQRYQWPDDVPARRSRPRQGDTTEPRRRVPPAG